MIKTSKTIIAACEQAKRDTVSGKNFNKDYEKDTVDCIEYDSYTDYTPIDVAFTTSCESGLCALSLINILNYLDLDFENLKNSTT